MIQGCLGPITAQNKSVIVDFDCRCALLSDISLAVAREEEATREKEEERERGRTLTHPDSALPSLDDPNLVGNTRRRFGFFLAEGRRRLRPSTSSPNAVDEKPQRRCLLLLSSSPKTRRRPHSFFSSEATRKRGGDVAEAAMLPRLLLICVGRRKGGN
ncbi:hypothetical protein B296_00022766, partial [Ensete ventricosum]